MQIEEQILLSFKGGPKVVVPNQLIEKEGSDTWLRLRPSSYPIAKLFLGHNVQYKSTKRPTLTHSTKFRELRDMVSAKIRQGNEVPVEGEDLFGTPAASSEKPKTKLVLQKAAKTLFLSVEGVECEFRTPKSWKETDIVCRLNARQLTAIGGFICEDTDGLLEQKKRKYERTGSFAKSAKVKKAASDNHGEDEREDEDDEESSAED